MENQLATVNIFRTYQQFPLSSIPRWKEKKKLIIVKNRSTVIEKGETDRGSYTS